MRHLQKLGRAPALGNEQSRIPGRVNPEIAVKRFHGVQEHGANSDAAQRSRDLPCYVAGLPYAHHHHVAAVSRDQFHCRGQVSVQPLGGARDGL